jgi:hypothetical protein
VSRIEAYLKQKQYLDNLKKNEELLRGKKPGWREEWRKFRLYFWRYIIHGSESRYLTLCGWVRVRSGWLIPLWHPKRYSHGNEIYDHQHAVNSQAYYDYVPNNPAPKRIVGHPKFPSYVRWAPYQFVLFCLILTLFTCVMSTTGSAHRWFLLAMWTTTAVSFYVMCRVRRDLQLDYTNALLGGAGVKQEIHNPNQVGRRWRKGTGFQGGRDGFPSAK